MRHSDTFSKLHRPFLLFLALILAGCATARPPVRAIPGVSMETLRSEVSVSVSGGARSGSARGYLVFKRPDRLHVVILSPFGTSLLELFSDGERIVCLLPGKMTAYRGTAADLAARGLLAEWSLLQWVLAPPPAAAEVGEATEVSVEGTGEKAFFYDNGLLKRKATGGIEVLYKDYREVDGVPFAERVRISGVGDERVNISFEEPEVNRPIEEELLVPNLEGYQVLPLADFPSKL